MLCPMGQFINSGLSGQIPTNSHINRNTVSRITKEYAILILFLLDFELPLAFRLNSQDNS